MADCDVFERLQVNTFLKGDSTLYWKLRSDFNEPGPYNFFVDLARSGGDDWTTLNKLAVVDDCQYTDPNQYVWGKETDYYYRVRLVLEDGRVFYSQPERPAGAWDKEDWLRAREIIRKEYLLQTKFVGSEGWLLKRRNWGPKCPSCLDYDTEMISQSNCPMCFGTGVLGGYYPGIQYWITSGLHGRSLDRKPQQGMTNDQDQQVRGIAYPFIDTGDMWVNKNSNEIWHIRLIQNIAKIREVPIIYQLAIRKVPTTDIIYTFPVPGGVDISAYYTTESEDSPVNLEDNPPEVDAGTELPPLTSDSWRAGLGADNDW